MAGLTGPELAPARGGSAEALVVLLHGVGADGADLIELGHDWAPLLPGAAFLAPDAPFPCDMAPFGRQWFSLQDRSPLALLEGVIAAAPLLTQVLETELARRALGWDRLALVGFSQGAMMALHVAPRLPWPVAGVIGYSGALLGPELLPAERRASPPVLLVHGEADDVVPVEATRMAGPVLTAAGMDVRTALRPRLGHGIDAEGVRIGGEFLAGRLGSAR